MTGVEKDQIGGGREDVVMSPPVAMGVHGYRANQVRILTSDGAQVVTAVDTGDAVFLVSVRAGDQETAVAEFDRVIQTFDLR